MELNQTRNKVGHGEGERLGVCDTLSRKPLMESGEQRVDLGALSTNGC